MAVIYPQDYDKFNPRVGGIKLLSTVRANHQRGFCNIAETRVITQDTFDYYLKNKKFNDVDEDNIKKEANHLLSISETGLLAVRRAYFIPSLENPPGPRHLGLKTAEETLYAIKDVFNFAIEHKYHKEKGSLVEAFFYPFIDPPQIKLPLKKNSVFPRGGYVAPMDKMADSVRVLAVYGNNEGVQSLSGVDEYIVDTKRMIITNKIIPQKEYALCTTNKSQDDKVKLPLNLQFSQVLNDLEVLEAAEVARECTKIQKSPQRIEYSSDGKTLFFNEVANYEIEEDDYGDMEIEGSVSVIKGPDDISKIERGNSKQVIFISKLVVQNRDYDTLNTIAAIKENLNILYPGSTVTAHAMRVLVDGGHKAFVVGGREFKENDKVRITSKNSEVEIELVSGGAKKTNIVHLSEANLLNNSAVGGKALNLGKLISLGYKVPNGYVIKTDVFDNEKFFESTEFNNFINTLDPKKQYSVRSSATVEDGSNNSFAGQFTTVLRVQPKKIKLAIQRVWASTHAQSVKYLANNLNLTNIKMAVVIQEMVDPEFSGVIFGGNIETRDGTKIVMEVTKGYAEGVVDGVARVRKLVFNKTTKELIADKNKHKIIFDSPYRDALLEMYLRLENNFGKSQDVEWSIGKDKDLYILQTRDLII